MADKTYNFTVGGRQFEIEGPEGMSEQAQREAVEDHLAVQPQQTLRFDGTGNLVDFAKQLPVGFARGIEGLPGVGPSPVSAMAMVLLVPSIMSRTPLCPPDQLNANKPFVVFQQLLLMDVPTHNL